MGFSIWTDWREEYKKNPDNIYNVGVSVLRRKQEKQVQECGHDNDGYECDKCEIYPDDLYYGYEPMMNYRYPLQFKPSDEDVLKVVEKTNCTVVYFNNEDTYYLSLTGGGMDLSQDIALAYTILNEWIPFDLAKKVSTQKGLSVGGKDFEVMMKKVQKTLEHSKYDAEKKIEKINEVLNEEVNDNE